MAGNWNTFKLNILNDIVGSLGTVAIKRKHFKKFCSYSCI